MRLLERTHHKIVHTAGNKMLKDGKSVRDNFSSINAADEINSNADFKTVQELRQPKPAAGFGFAIGFDVSSK